ncbi:MAG: glycosyltransferase family 39 protein [Alphaproteobacteria bacterium]|nr:glycosyltransferase family 39 protein [Alphaproteobacteria bacterium]
MSRAGPLAAEARIAASTGNEAPRAWLAPLLLAAIAAAAWAPALRGGFHFDDLPNIVLDPATAGGAALAERLANGFRPLLRLSYALDHALWGFDAAGFLATNLVLHAVTVLLVWRLACRRLAEPAAALAAAAIFALQPAHGAVVAWSSGRSTGLSTLLLVAALLAHERAVRRPGASRQAPALLLMAVACLAKEVALVFPLVVLLWETTRAEFPGWRTALRRATPSIILAGLGGAAMLFASPRLRELLQFSFALATPDAALAAHLAAVPATLSLWVRPWSLAIEHPAPTGALATIAGAAVVAAMIALAVQQRRARPLLALALLWPLVLLLPTHSVIARLDVIVEKPLYAAWIGPCLALGALAAAITRAPGRLRAGLAAAAMLALAALSAWRAEVWAEPVAVWREAATRNPGSARAWINRAVAELEAGDVAAARRWIAVARGLDPGAAKIADAEFALSLMLSTAREDAVR